MSDRGGGAAGGGRPRIFLVEDHTVFRAGVRAELGDAVEVIGEADEVAAAIELISERLPDVVLLDVHLPGGGGQARSGAIGWVALHGPIRWSIIVKVVRPLETCGRRGRLDAKSSPPRGGVIR